MKIKDIISEAGPTSYVPASPGSSIVVPTSLSPNGSTIPVAASGGSAAPAASGGSAAPRPRAQRQSGKRASALRQQRIKNAVIKMSTIGSGRYKNMINMKYSKFTATMIIPLRLLQFLGLGEMIVDFGTTVSTLRTMKELPEGDPGHITEQEYDDNWRQALELLAVQIAASAALPRLIQAFTLGKWVTRILGFLGTTATWGATLAIFVASEVAMIAFQRWLTSPEGRKQLTYLIVYVIDPLATWLYPTSFVDKIKEIVGIETKKTDDKKKDPNAPKTDTGQAAQPKPQGQTDTTIPTANVPPSYVGNPNDLMKRDEPKVKFAMDI